ncbi:MULTISPECIES: hypothetical protein [Sphingomonadaceae]|uniref:hypothetical protein n=1 Tax=Sphingomonadaceae TaxID=41297 RepID=UPI00115706B7|nr:MULTISPECIES: hypothetical protein [Sphingomonadaceae]QDK34762.1 hypothetical protein DM450_0095 [Sphingomonas sp. IC081]QSR18995.1 hypothetical protein CA833_0055 [Novosphingobium sp. KA1]
MNIAFEHETCKAGHASGRDGEEFIPAFVPIDWFALRSRLFAAHDLRAVLDAEPSAARVPGCGSFAKPAANVIHAYDGGEPTINPNDLTIRKSRVVSFASVTGGRSTGARGC